MTSRILVVAVAAVLLLVGFQAFMAKPADACVTCLPTVVRQAAPGSISGWDQTQAPSTWSGERVWVHQANPRCTVAGCFGGVEYTTYNQAGAPVRKSSGKYLPGRHVVGKCWPGAQAQQCR